jgi:hypothetical protein
MFIIGLHQHTCSKLNIQCIINSSTDILLTFIKVDCLLVTVTITAIGFLEYLFIFVTFWQSNVLRKYRAIALKNLDKFTSYLRVSRLAILNNLFHYFEWQIFKTRTKLPFSFRLATLHTVACLLWVFILNTRILVWNLLINCVIKWFILQFDYFLRLKILGIAGLVFDTRVLDWLKGTVGWLTSEVFKFVFVSIQRHLFDQIKINLNFIFFALANGWWRIDMVLLNWAFNLEIFTCWSMVICKVLFKFLVRNHLLSNRTFQQILKVWSVRIQYVWTLKSMLAVLAFFIDCRLFHFNYLVLFDRCLDITLLDRFFFKDSFLAKIIVIWIFIWRRMNFLHFWHLVEARSYGIVVNISSSRCTVHIILDSWRIKSRITSFKLPSTKGILSLDIVKLWFHLDMIYGGILVLRP